MALEHKVRRALGPKTLGETPDAIATRLFELGIKGRRNDVYYCPIARYLCQVLDIPVISPAGPLHRVFVSNSIQVYSEEENKNVVISRRDALADFIRRFDQGQYPKLDKYAS